VPTHWFSPIRSAVMSANCGKRVNNFNVIGKGRV